MAVNVLLIEDNPGDVRLLEAMLESRPGGYVLTSVPRMQDASEMIEKIQFDVVLLDLGLPDSYGVETVDTARQKLVGSNVPIIVITGAMDERRGLEVLRHGAQDFLIKNDLKPEPLIRAIDLVVRRREETDADPANRIRMPHRGSSGQD
ncbi:response regulator [Cucumibacter marinus]|uniref:response regulator n=1 Tax=Cucumibacter marinus TaxID=1121252 RepID=UPI0004210EE5|nr:response regulator [Cucumibacter marinus]